MKSKGRHTLVSWCILQVSYIESSRAHTIIKPPTNFISHILWNMFILDATEATNAHYTVSQESEEYHYL